MPKTIIYCNTINALAQVVNYLNVQLGNCAFYPNSSTEREDCLIGIYHPMIQEKYKRRIFDSLKGSGKNRAVNATSALSMGFNQQAGRTGRDGTLAHTVLFYYGQQVAHVEDEVR